MDQGLERIRRLTQQAHAEERAQARQADRDLAQAQDNRSRAIELEDGIPARLRQVSDASDGDLTFEDSADDCVGSKAYDVWWQGGKPGGRGFRLWIHTEDGSIEWEWRMGRDRPPVAKKVPAADFDLDRLDNLVAAMAEWRSGAPPDA